MKCFRAQVEKDDGRRDSSIKAKQDMGLSTETQEREAHFLQVSLQCQNPP